MPPSADDLPGRKPPKERTASSVKRQQGKQPGAEGKALAWSGGVHDGDILDHYPQGASGAGPVTAAHQQTEIPLVSTRGSSTTCKCGTVHTAARPAGVKAAPVGLGANLQAWCTCPPRPSTAGTS